MSIVVKKMGMMATILICILTFTTTALAMSFSADIVSSDDGKTIKKEKIYMTNSKVRVETDEMVNILRMDKKLVWMLMPEDRMYMEQEFNLATAKNQKQTPTAEPPADEDEKIFILRETVNGYVADKYQINAKKQDSHYIWLSSDPGIMMQVKTAAIDGSWWQEFRNIRLGEPDPVLFEIPDGFSKMSMAMPGMFGNY
ncbi:hypothetical protein SOV_08770 [Sporomusa ovata DSM 2662]|uniref:DUF4412 domain-containing protein n=1 Tax=Sporomusa ovata TaxID=2378 RepID=A0A0U1L580_9FIRM|nr:DUF4412 domain-containing protein [Sporomusa ovata]EQB28526.1 hypothetical protein SOV_1c02150 [Sporomusa ovata DSM 2662]CQR74856.1 hypothetical protein SpAn4DRAFT_4213 [Sporomusa ovata]